MLVKRRPPNKSGRPVWQGRGHHTGAIRRATRSGPAVEASAKEQQNYFDGNWMRSAMLGGRDMRGRGLVWHVPLPRDRDRKERKKGVRSRQAGRVGATGEEVFHLGENNRFCVKQIVLYL